MLHYDATFLNALAEAPQFARTISITPYSDMAYIVVSLINGEIYSVPCPLDAAQTFATSLYDAARVIYANACTIYLYN
jgi:hypothetical protein